LITDQEFTEKRLEPYFPTMQKTKPRTMTDDELLSLLAEVLPAGWRGSASEVARLVGDVVSAKVVGVTLSKLAVDRPELLKKTMSRGKTQYLWWGSKA
jgi:hypothetical protein